MGDFPTGAPSSGKLGRALWVAALGVAALGGAFMLYIKAQEEHQRAFEQLTRSVALSDELRQTSDDLTRMVRTYVITGDPRFKAQFHEIIEIRNGKAPRPGKIGEIYWDLVLNDSHRPVPFGPPVALLDLMRQAGFSSDEFSLLNEAKAASDALTKIEFSAMALVESDTSVDARFRASRLLHDDTYHQAKADIMRTIAKFDAMVKERNLAAVGAAEATANRLRLVVILLAAVLSYVLWRLFRMINEEKLARETGEAFYRSVADNGQTLIWMAGADRQCCYFNKPWLDFTGRTLEQEIGSGWTAGVHPDDARRNLEVFAGAFDRHEPLSREYRLKHHSGEYRWVLDEAIPRYGADHAFIGYIGHCMDVTSLKQAALITKRFEAIVQSSEDAIVSKTLDGVVTSWNQGAESIFGYRSEEAICKPIGDLIPLGFRFEEAGILAKITQGEAVSHFETRGQCKGGKIIDVSVAVSPIHDADGKVTGISVIARDITERKRVEGILAGYRDDLERQVRQRTQELTRAKEAAEAANIAKTAFLANMSHELRTPLNAVTGMVYLMRRGGVTPQQADRLGKIETAAEHLLEIVDTILELAKIEAGKLVLDETALCIEKMVENVVGIIRPRAEAKGLRLDANVSPMPPGLLGDQTRLQQALLNYMSNAVKFTDSGGIELRARVVADAPDQSTLRFDVCDTGTGIAPDVIPRLFSAFEQADNSITRKYGGTGLGLAITRRFAEMMGGEAGVTSEPGQGSTFWLTVRLRKSGEAFRPEGARVASGTEEILKQSFTGVRVLVVDDDLNNREVSRAMLEEAGLRVDVAEDGVQALDLADKHDYALILMDMQMPRMDGLEATRRIRALGKAQRVPILAMTASAFAQDRVECAKAGMDDFIVKPIHPETLFSTLLQWLKRPG